MTEINHETSNHLSTEHPHPQPDVSSEIRDILSDFSSFFSKNASEDVSPFCMGGSLGIKNIVPNSIEESSIPYDDSSQTECEKNEEKEEIEKATHLKFPDFKNIKVSTRTYIVITNIELNISKLFEFLPITNYTVVPKKRGRKKKNQPVDVNKGIRSGSIITLKYESNLRGVDLKKKSGDKKVKGNYFRNSVTVVMIIDGKKINFKISRNGKYQITGCKTTKHAEQCIKYIWKYIKDEDDIYKLTGDCFNSIYVPAMRNIDFSLGFIVDREKLDEYINVDTEYKSLLETSFGYTGVNIKMIIKKDITTLKLKQLKCENGRWCKPEFVDYNEYLKVLIPKEQDKKIKKKRYNTFLVFHSGRVIMSGMEESFMENVYYEFLDIIRNCWNVIEERLDL